MVSLFCFQFSVFIHNGWFTLSFVVLDSEPRALFTIVQKSPPGTLPELILSVSTNYNIPATAFPQMVFMEGEYYPTSHSAS